MTPVNANFDEMLRGALHTEVDSLEPADGGLDRIRRRTHAPWLVRQASLMLTECVDLVRLIGIRLEPWFTGRRAAIVARGGLWAAFAGVISSAIASVAAPQRRSAMHRRRSSGSDGTSAGRPPSNLSWLRPALAVVGAVAIVVAGVFGLVQVRDNLALELFHSNTPARTGAVTASTSAQVPTLQGHSATGAIVPPGTQQPSHKPSPKATCSTAPNPQATPTSTPTDTTTPLATPSGTAIPTPTDTTNPSPTATAATSTSAADGGTGTPTAANVTPTATCTSTPS